MAVVETPLLRRQAYVGGRWVDADCGETFPVINPATGETLGSVPRMDTADTRRALEAAERALPAWRALTAKERARIRRRLADPMLGTPTTWRCCSCSSKGNPLAEGKRVYGDTIPELNPDRRISCSGSRSASRRASRRWTSRRRCRRGSRRRRSRLAARWCSSPRSRNLSALAVAALAEEAGVPPGVFSVVTGRGRAGDRLRDGVESDRAQARLHGLERRRQAPDGAQCAAGLKKISRSSSAGTRPVIVFDDADLDKAVPGAVLCKYRNSGQTWISANRILVQDGIYDEFLSRFVERVRGLKVVDGFTEGVDVGPLIDAQGLEGRAAVAEAVERCAELVLGGSRIEGADMAMSCEETFGPVAGIASFSTEEEAVRIANDTPYGLSAYFYPERNSRIWRVSGRSSTASSASTPVSSRRRWHPSGGVKESGIGREGSKYGIDEWLELKYPAIEL